MIGSVAGTPMSQAKGTDTDKNAQDTVDQSRESKTAEKAEQAAGVGQTEQDEQASERDADGRRLWEDTGDGSTTENTQEDSPQGSALSKDPTGQSGTQLDLSG